MKVVIISLLVGSLAGLLGALCGIGGGIVMVPFFTGALNLTQKHAVATSLAVIVITAAVATVNNTSNKLIDWRIVACAATGAALAAWFGSDLMQKLSNQHLTKIFGMTLVIFGVHMLFKK